MGFRKIKPFNGLSFRDNEMSYRCTHEVNRDYKSDTSDDINDASYDFSCALIYLFVSIRISKYY